MLGITVVDIKYRSLPPPQNGMASKTACFISLNPKHQKQEQKYLGRTKITLATNGAHMQHTL